MAQPNIDSRRLNPVVDRFATTDLPLGVIIDATPKPHAKQIKALQLLQDCLDGRRLAKDAINAARAVDIKGIDPEMLILMLSRWSEVACRIGRPSEAEALIHQARTLSSDSTHPEIRAAATLAETRLADTTGNKEHCEQMLREILDFVPSHSPRRKLYVWELALFLAQQGRGIDMEDDLKELTWQCNERFSVNRVLIVRFINAVETGNIRDASHLMPEIATNPRLIRDLKYIPYKGYQSLLHVMHGAAEKGGSVPPPMAETDPPWVRVAAHLLSKNIAEALRLARSEANRTLGALFGSGFPAFNLIRAELSSGAHEGAKRLLAMRAARGNRHYLDDFFMARAELLADNRRAAKRHFASLLDAVEYFRAQGRRDFELSLACELAHGDIVFLSKITAKPTRPTQGPGAQREPHKAQGTTEAPAKPALLNLSKIIGKSRAIADTREAVVKYAILDAPVLITGETGTGKELVARALHEASDRRKQPFIPVNCGTIAETLLESELFGHERGAFTGAEKANKGLFEESGDGTIFLDEIGDVSPHLQSALLRVLETGEIRAVGSAKTRNIRCRVVAATNTDLAQLAEERRFRSDLMYRLQRLELHIPSLRERRDDILLLARHFLDLGRKIGLHAKISERLSETLRNYDWPGNVRELRNVIERMRLMHSDKLTYDLEDLDLKFQALNVPAPEPALVEPALAAPAPELPTEGPTLSPDVASILRKGRSQIRRLDHLRDLFTKFEKLTRGEVIEIMGVSPNTATKDLKALCKEGFIERIEPSASSRSYYFQLKRSDEEG